MPAWRRCGSRPELAGTAPDPRHGRASRAVPTVRVVRDQRDERDMFTRTRVRDVVPSVSGGREEKLGSLARGASGQGGPRTSSAAHGPRTRVRPQWRARGDFVPAGSCPRLITRLSARLNARLSAQLSGRLSPATAWGPAHQRANHPRLHASTPRKGTGFEHSRRRRAPWF